jgi:hypothetical protein
MGQFEETLQYLRRGHRRWSTVAIIAAGSLFALAGIWFLRAKFADIRVFRRSDPIGALTHLPAGSLINLRGTVTFCDAGSDRLFIEDGTGTARILLGGRPCTVRAGHVVHVAAVLVGDPSSVRTAELRAGSDRIDIVSESTLPPAAPAPLSGLIAGKRISTRVQVQAVVRRVERRQDQLLLLLGSDGVEISATLAPARATPAIPIDSSVLVRGVLEFPFKDEHWTTQARLWVAQPSGLVVEEGSPANVPVVGSTRSLLKDRSLIARGHLVSLAGRLVKYPSGCALIHDGQAATEVELSQPTDIDSGTFVEATGFPTRRGYRVFLKHVSLRAVAAPAAGDADTGPVLRTTAAVHNLSKEEAARHYPVRLRAVVAYYDPHTNGFFVRDATGGIYAGGRSQEEHLRAGQEVLITGLTTAGNFSPMVSNVHTRLLGWGKLPNPRPIAPIVPRRAWRLTNSWRWRGSFTRPTSMSTGARYSTW